MKEAKITLMENPADGSVLDPYSIDSYPESGFYVWPDNSMFFVDKIQKLANYIGMVPMGWSGFFREPVIPQTMDEIPGKYMMEGVSADTRTGPSTETLLKAIAVALKPELAFKKENDDESGN